MLDNIEKKNPFSVPENYFQNFNSEIMNNLPEKEGNKKKIIPLWKSVTKWAAAAAVVTGIAFVGFNYLSDNSHQSIDSMSADASLATEDSTTALENDYYQFLEEEATRIAYKDEFYNDDSF